MGGRGRQQSVSGWWSPCPGGRGPGGSGRAAARPGHLRNTASFLGAEAVCLRSRKQLCLRQSSEWTKQEHCHLLPVCPQLRCVTVFCASVSSSVKRGVGTAHLSRLL